MEEAKQKFIDDYNELVKKHKLQLAAIPMYKMRDDGTYSLIITYDVYPYNVKEEKTDKGIDK